jgi:phosphopantetheinyl transferase (holo-ACP synthase)
MIGTDIIDIIETKKNSNWGRPRFLEKLFTFNEQKLIHDSENKFIMVWRLWSMKEAAYKLYTQLNPARFYNPKQFVCDINGDALKVRYKAFECHINTKITETYILSEASLLPRMIVSKTFKSISKDYKNQSKTTRAALILSVSKQYNIEKSQLNISKSELGIPSIYHNSTKLNVGISISHHGNYGSYAVSLL